MQKKLICIEGASEIELKCFAVSLIDTSISVFISNLRVLHKIFSRSFDYFITTDLLNKTETEAYSETCQTSEMERFTKIFYG